MFLDQLADDGLGENSLSRDARNLKLRTRGRDLRVQT
jgi:hypothetical protein